MNIIDCIQGTQEWKAARVGKVTASMISTVLAKGKNGAESATRADYRMQIACELLTGASQDDTFFSKDMVWGVEQEPFARAAYEVDQSVSVDQIGMVIHPTMNRAAASPDGLVEWDGLGTPDGLVEIKCPKTKNHVKYIQTGGVPADYQPQMLWQMACTGAKWVDFVSFDPRLPEALQLYICRFHRDEARIAEIEREVARFLGEVDDLLETLKQLTQAA